MERTEIAIIDTHCHLDGEEYAADREQVVARALDAGVVKMLLPAVDLASSLRIRELSLQYPGRLYHMVGLHPEEVRSDWQSVLAQLFALLPASPSLSAAGVEDGLDLAWLADRALPPAARVEGRRQEPVAIGEVGLDFYWSREYAQEQLLAFEQQVRWSVATRLPLMIHCRKAQHELVSILKRYAGGLPGGVFHCFTGNEKEAQELLQFPRFMLGIGGVLTFKKSRLAETLSSCVPLSRIVLETDSPYMAPVPLRGRRNEPAFVVHVLARLSQAYGLSEAEVAARTSENVARLFF